MPRLDVAFSLAGVGTYEPRTVVRSSDLDALHGRVKGVSAAFGIQERRYASPDETTSMMAVAAVHGALDDAGWSIGDVQVLIGACGVMEQPIPGTAPLVQRGLGLGNSGIPAMDVNATCLSFLPALDLALAGMAMDRWRRAVIFASDIASAALDHADLESSVIFGDGAAAVAIEAGGTSRLLASRLETYGTHADLCSLDAGGTRLRPNEDLAAFLAGCSFRMQGHALFKATARRFPAFLNRLLDESGEAIETIGSIIPHQASAPALEHLSRVVGGDRSRIVDVFGTLGNRVASSMPHALAVAAREGRLIPGSTSLLIGSSAGISLGGAVIRW